MSSFTAVLGAALLMAIFSIHNSSLWQFYPPSGTFEASYVDFFEKLFEGITFIVHNDRYTALKAYASPNNVEKLLCTLKATVLSINISEQAILKISCSVSAEDYIRYSSDDFQKYLQIATQYLGQVG